MVRTCDADPRPPLSQALAVHLYMLVIWSLASPMRSRTYGALLAHHLQERLHLVHDILDLREKLVGSVLYRLESNANGLVRRFPDHAVDVVIHSCRQRLDACVHKACNPWLLGETQGHGQLQRRQHDLHERRLQVCYDLVLTAGESGHGPTAREPVRLCRRVVVAAPEAAEGRRRLLNLAAAGSCGQSKVHSGHGNAEVEDDNNGDGHVDDMKVPCRPLSSDSARKRTLNHRVHLCWDLLLHHVNGARDLGFAAIQGLLQIIGIWNVDFQRRLQLLCLLEHGLLLFDHAVNCPKQILDRPHDHVINCLEHVGHLLLGAAENSVHQVKDAPGACLPAIRKAHRVDESSQGAI
mmetsp:Transcript_41880/g.130381  ORF Transcript_41880/g.130381 Transcript_41880/m.130381 type:complete len:351 (-) Transcript_41880:613-1665(-)